MLLLSPNSMETHRLRSNVVNFQKIMMRGSVHAMVRVFDVHLKRRQLVEREKRVEGLVNEDEGDERGETLFGETRDEDDEKTEIEGHRQQ